MLSIRPATASDAPHLSRLNTQWLYPASPETVIERIARIRSTSVAEIFVAETETEVVGWLHIFGRSTMGSDGFAEIGGLIVDENHRQQGIARKLVAEALLWAGQNGFEKVVVRTSDRRTEANAFYPRVGFLHKKMQHVFEFSI